MGTFVYVYVRIFVLNLPFNTLQRIKHAMKPTVDLDAEDDHPEEKKLKFPLIAINSHD